MTEQVIQRGPSPLSRKRVLNADGSKYHRPGKFSNPNKRVQAAYDKRIAEFERTLKAVKNPQAFKRPGSRQCV